MTVRLVALSGTPLLVPGAAGGAEVLADYRAAVLDALRDLAGAGPVVVVARGPTTRRGTFRASLGAFGIDDGRLGWSDDGRPGWSDDAARPGAPRDLAAPPDGDPSAAPADGDPSAAPADGDPSAAPADGDPSAAAARALAGPCASVAILAVRAAGWTGPVEVVEVSPTEPVDSLADLGRTLRASGAAVVVAEDPDRMDRPGSVGDPARVVRDEVADGGSMRAFLGEYESRRYELVTW